MVDKCQWCGKPLRKKHKNQRYHKGNCETEARKEQIRLARSRYYFKNRDSSNTLGNCNLSKVFILSKQDKEVRAEMKRIGLSH